MSNFGNLDPDRFRKQFRQKDAEASQAAASAMALAEEEGFRAGWGMVLEVVELCELCGEPHLAGDFLREGLTPSDVKERLVKAGKLSGRIQSNTLSKSDLKSNPLLRDAKQRSKDAGQKRGF